jgi:hypothetical protein
MRKAGTYEAKTSLASGQRQLYEQQAMLPMPARALARFH